MVQSESDNGGPTRWSDADDRGAIFAPAEMLVPALLARIEQGKRLGGLRVGRVRLSVFEFIAAAAGKPQVFFDGLPAQSVRDEVFNLHCRADERFARQAISAPITRLLPDAPGQSDWNLAARSAHGFEEVS